MHKSTSSATLTPAARLNPSARRHRWAAACAGLRRVNLEGSLAIVLLLLLWQFASSRSSPMFFPPLASIVSAARELLLSTDSALAISTTWLRIIISLAGSFALAMVLGVAAALFRPVERFIIPLIELKQGIPAACWVIFAIIWFKDTEIRIAFVVVTTALPSFFYQIRDAVKGIPKEWVDMVRSLRPSMGQLLVKLALPAMLPMMLTVWRINIGNATRVVIVAELLGGVSGIGYQLRLAQELFQMDAVIAWTAVLMAFVLISNQILSFAERRLLKWRADEGMRHE